MAFKRITLSRTWVGFKPQVTQAHCVCHMGKYREHMRRSFGLEICWKMEIKIDETYHVVRSCCP